MDSKMHLVDRKDQPLVSIVIPVFNGSNFLSFAIESALDQDSKNIEILVVNDGSDDQGKTELIIRRYEKFIRSFNKPNGGVASALNLAVDEMHGNFFSWLSHDDLYDKSKVTENYAKYLECRNPNTIIYSDFEEYFERSKKKYEVKLEHIQPSHFRYWLLKNSRLHGCTLFIPRHAFDVCGKFDENLATTQDYDLWLRMSRVFDFVHIEKALVISRIHPQQDSHTASILALKECNQLYAKYSLELTDAELREASGQTSRQGMNLLLESLIQRGWHDAAEILKNKVCR
jgi:glycosyltransferase involved in cell wall biosynthesis